MHTFGFHFEVEWNAISGLTHEVSNLSASVLGSCIQIASSLVTSLGPIGCTELTKDNGCLQPHSLFAQPYEESYKCAGVSEHK